MTHHPERHLLERLLQSTGEAPDVALHVLGCDHCRDRLATLRALETARAGLAVQRPRRSLRGEILAAVGKTEAALETRSIEQVPAKSRSAPRAAAAIGALLVGMSGLAWLTSGQEALASRSQLRFDPADPEPGDEITVEYRPSSLTGRRLILRARLRTAGDTRTYDEFATVTLTGLQQTDDGVLRGRFVLPDSVMYVAAAVETPNGEATDNNFGQLWELVQHRDGSPTPEGLMQKVEDHLIRNWQVALATSRELTALYPDYIPGWRARYAREKAITPEAGLDSLRTFHRANLFRLSDTWSTIASVDAVSAFELAFYAEMLGESGLVDRWKQRLYGQHPDHPLSQEFHAVDAVHAHFGDATRLLAVLDSLWTSSPAGHQSLAWEGVQTASRVGLAAEGRMWAARYAGVPETRARYGTYPARMLNYVASILTAFGDTIADDAAIRLLEEHVRARRASSMRPVGVTDEAWQLELEDLRRSALVMRAHLERDRQRAAEADSLLREAAELGWSPEINRTLAENLPGYEEAARYAARWAVDPETSAVAADSIAALYGVQLGRKRWEALVDAATERLRVQVDRATFRRPIRGTPRLTGLDGRTESLASLRQGGVTLIAYWSRWCEPSLRQLEQLDALAGRFRESGFGVVTISDEPASAELGRFLKERGLSMPVLFDPDRSTSQALGQWGTPQYFLVDGDGVVRYESRKLGDLYRVAKVTVDSKRREEVDL